MRAESEVSAANGPRERSCTSTMGWRSTTSVPSANARFAHDSAPEAYPRAQVRVLRSPASCNAVDGFRQRGQISPGLPGGPTRVAGPRRTTIETTFAPSATGRLARPSFKWQFWQLLAL